MAYLRSICYYLVFGLSLLFYGLLALPLSLISSKNFYYNFCTSWLMVIRKVCLPILGIRLRSHGLENVAVPSQPAVVYLIKHQSQLETLIVPTYFKTKFSYVFKKEIYRLPFLGWALTKMDMIGIDRSKPSQAFKMIQSQGCQLLRQGTCVALYPEGTRVARGKRGNYKIGGAMLAVTAGVKIVPVAVTSARCWTPGFAKQAGIVDVSFGNPIDSSNKTAPQLLELAANWIEQEMQRLDPSAYKAAANSQ